MREPILKAVAMPPRVFWAPMLPMVANFSVQMAIMLMLQGAFPGRIIPDFFIWSFVIVHIFLVIYSRKEPHLSKIMQSFGSVINHWNKDTLKNDTLKIREENGALITGDNRIVRCISFEQGLNSTTEFQKWLEQIQVYPIKIQIQQSLDKKDILIFSAPMEHKNDLDYCVRYTLSALSSAWPQETDSFETRRLWDILNGKIIFQKKEKIIRLPDNTYLGFVGIQKLGDFSDSEMLFEILNLGPRVFIQHHIESIQKDKANLLLIQQRKIALFTTFSQNIYDQYTDALISLQNGSSLNRYMLSIGVNASTLSDLDFLRKQITGILKRYGYQGICEKNLNKALFLTQFPDKTILPREVLFLSNNISSMVCSKKR